MYSMMEDNSESFRSAQFKKLTKAICGLVSGVLNLITKDRFQIGVLKSFLFCLSR